MTEHVVIERVHALLPGNFWKTGVSDLIIDAAAPVVNGLDIDAVFSACAGPFERQADQAAIVADRLGLKPRIALSLDAGDVSGAAALYAGFVHVQSGAAKTALIVAAAKVSDVSEAERLSCLDRTLDQDADIANGLDFATQAGLLAGHYCRTRGLDARVFAETTAVNLGAWAKHIERPAVSAAELRRDLVAAAPLVRSDFAQLLDGACALVLTRGEGTGRVVIEAMTSATDVVSPWDRADPLAFAAVERAFAALLAMGHSTPNWWEIDGAASIVQRLAEDALWRAIGPRQSEFSPVVNVRGGPYGRGRVFGASSLYQIADIVEARTIRPNALALAVAGLGSHAFAAHLSTGMQP